MVATAAFKGYGLHSFLVFKMIVGRKLLKSLGKGLLT